MDTAPITVVMPAIMPRMNNLLNQAIISIQRQTLQPTGGISCALDVNKEGAAVTRQRALDGVRTEWVAFLDDDDVWYPHHLAILWELAQRKNALYVWSWFDGNNPFPQHRGRQMDINNPHHTTMTVLVRTDIAQAAGFRNHPDENDIWPGEDWNFTLKCIEAIRKHCNTDVEANAKFACTSDITWHYRVHGRNTSGLPTKW